MAHSHGWELVLAVGSLAEPVSCIYMQPVHHSGLEMEFLHGTWLFSEVSQENQEKTSQTFKRLFIPIVGSHVASLLLFFLKQFQPCPESSEGDINFSSWDECQKSCGQYLSTVSLLF